MESKVDELLEHIPVIVNMGVQDFALSVQTRGASVIHVDWSPPASDDEEMMTLLDKLI